MKQQMLEAELQTVFKTLNSIETYIRTHSLLEDAWDVADREEVLDLIKQQHTRITDLIHVMV